MTPSNTPRDPARPAETDRPVFVKPAEDATAAPQLSRFQLRLLQARRIVRWTLVPCAVLAVLSPLIANQYPSAVVLAFEGFLGGLGLFAVGLLALSGVLSMLCGLWSIKGPRSALAVVSVPLIALWALVDGPLWMMSAFDVRTVEGVVTDVHVHHFKRSTEYTVWIDGKPWSARERAGKAVEQGDRISCRYPHAPAVIADELLDCKRQ